MSDIAIRVENVGKRFELGELGTASDFYRKSKALARRLLRPSRNGHGDPDKPWEHETDPTAFWALKGIDFEVKEGEVLGIIGANGAGKSTLLKVLSRITAPTTGHIELFGRVASLLEVGTGFHPELTGRENVYLNGSILGMTRAEINSKLDEIIDFAGVEKFIDTPVKRYSSGMRVRLGFAVAAHLEPEILIIDEVLAVGDIEFQRKCLGKMREVASSGRTVLFVSHKMSSVEQLCDRAILLTHGVLAENGDPATVIMNYASSATHTRTSSPKDSNIHNDEDAFLTDAQIINSRGERTPILKFGEPFSVQLTWKRARRYMGAVYNIQVFDNYDELMFAANTIADNVYEDDSQEIVQLRCNVAQNVLLPGSYRVDAGLHLQGAGRVQSAERCLTLTVTDAAWDNTRPFTTKRGAKFCPQYRWVIDANSGTTEHVTHA